AEQQYFEVEKRLAQSQERLVNETQECQTLREELKKLHEQLKVLNEKNKELEAAQDRNAAVQSQLSREKEELEAEKRDLVRTTERRSQEVEHLNEDVKRLNEKLTEANTEKAKLQLKLDELQTSDVSMKYREKRLEQEKELLQNQNTWLNAELKAKTDELLHTAREKGNEILELKCSLENKKEEVSRMEEQVNSLKQSNENLQKHVEELLNKLKEAKEQQASMEERFHNELNAHMKLSNLYKVSFKFCYNCSRGQILGNAGQFGTNKAAQEHLAEVEESKAVMEKELREKISKLEKELENANDLLSATKRKGAILSEEELAAMSPTAAAVAKVVKPGMKLTELYNAYVETQDQLHMEKLENKRINKYLDEIVQEVEAKAPILKRQREEFERSQKAVASLSAKLEQAMKEIHRLQDSADQANKHASFFERESQRLEVRVKDLSQQICVLLMELEEARGNHVIRDEAVSSADISSSSEVITQHLVSYRNIQELQQQNQRLLVALRELGEAREKEEQETTSSK
ncbi:TPR protein, partial [Edolisoma coerulescens]|nr:TPR protein [Edolisoma coerulescens]